jgi:YVTN family beta-propeller protein
MKYYFFLCGTFAIAIVLISSQAFAQASPDAPKSGLMNSRAIAFSPATSKVYVVSTASGAVDIYSDISGQMHRVKVGAEPVSVAVNAKTGTAYVANAGDGTVTVLDGKTDAVLATVTIGGRLYSIAADPATNKVFITHTFGDQLSILDGATNTATDLHTGGEDLISINSQAGLIYLLGYGGNVKVLNESTHQLNERSVLRHAWGLTLDESTGTVYVAGIESAALTALSGSSSESATLPVGQIPSSIAVDSNTNTLYVANYGDGTVTVLDPKAQKIIATLHVGSQPKSIVFDSIRNLVYVANTHDNTVTVIDANHNTVLATLPAGKNPYALAVAPGSNRLYVANEVDDKSSSIVDLSQISKSAP